MSDGLKTALIIGGAAVAGFFIWKHNQPTVANLTAGLGTSNTSGLAPGSPASPPPLTGFAGGIALGAPIVATTASTGGGGSSTTSKLVTATKLAFAPVYYPTVYGIKAGAVVAKGAVTVAKDIGSAASSVGHAIASLF